jgi:hypothetical protein
MMTTKLNLAEDLSIKLLDQYYKLLIIKSASVVSEVYAKEGGEYISYII